MRDAHPGGRPEARGVRTLRTSMRRFSPRVGFDEFRTERTCTGGPRRAEFLATAERVQLILVVETRRLRDRFPAGLSRFGAKGLTEFAVGQVEVVSKIVNQR